MRACKNCGADISDKGKKAKFCGENCRANYYYHKRNKQINTLRGIDIDNKLLPDLEKVDEEKDLNTDIDTQELDKSRRGLITKNRQPGIDTELTNEFNEPFSQKQDIGTEKSERPYAQPEEELPEMFIEEEHTEPNPEHLKLVQSLKEIQAKKENLIKQFKQLAEQLKYQQSRNGNEWIWGTAAVSGAAGYLLTPDKKPREVKHPPTFRDANGKRFSKDSARYRMALRRWQEENGITDEPALSGNKKFLNAFLWGLAGAGAGFGIKALTKNSREEDKQQEIKKIILQINETRKQIDQFSKRIEDTKNLSAVLPQYLNKTRQVVNPAYQDAILKRKQRDEQSGVEELQRTSLNELSKKRTNPLPPFKISSDKIKKAKDAANEEYPAYDFKGIFYQFFGQPAVNFTCIVHGNAGEGKSTFCLWFARYLAECFGRVLYVSAEEGINKTFTDKLNACQADIEDFYVSGEIHSGEELMKEVRPHEFHFIILDSLHDMSIDPEMLKKIKETYPKSAIIAITQNNKAGEMIGKNELKHLVEIVVRVRDFQAETTKNRFKQKGEVSPTVAFGPQSRVKKDNVYQLRIVTPKKDNKEGEDGRDDYSLDDDRRGIV